MSNNTIATDPTAKEPFFREVLSILLEKDIGDISIYAQSTFSGDTPEHRGICMDVEITEHDDSPASCTVYNVEPQRYTETHLQKRVRFYQAKKDAKGLKRGVRDWNKLPDLYMIIIVNYDPFGEDSMIYTFENTCKKSIKELLLYLDSSKTEYVTNDSIEKLHNYVTDIKQEAEVINRFMTVGEWLDYEVRDAKIAAIAEGKTLGLAEGCAEGRKIELKDMLINFLTPLGIITEDIYSLIDTADTETLRTWIKLAAKVDSVEEFLEQVK